MQKTWPGVRSSTGLPMQPMALCENRVGPVSLSPPEMAAGVPTGTGLLGAVCWMGMLLPCRACPRLFLWAKVWEENDLGGSDFW